MSGEMSNNGFESIQADDELLSVFQDEALELCQHAYIQLEKLVEAIDSNELNELLRHLHTLKGCAHLISYQGLVELCHILEAKLQGVQNSTQLINWEVLFASIEFIRMAVSQIHTKKAPIPPHYLLEKDLENFSQKSNTLPATVDPSTHEKQAVAWEQSGYRVSIALMESYSSSLRKLIKNYSDTTWQIETQNETLVQLNQVVSSFENNWMKMKDKDVSDLQVRINIEQALQNDVWQLKSLIGTLSRSQAVSAGLNDVQGSEIKSLENNIIKSRLIGFKYYIPRLTQLVSLISGKLGKQVVLKCEKTEAEVDKRLLEKLMPAFEHLIRNAIDHGIESVEERKRANKSETGTITITLRRENNQLIFEFFDDGHGIDKAKIKERAHFVLKDQPSHLTDEDILAILKQPGFSTKEEATTVSGRGVGVEAVDHLVRSLGGELRLDTKKNIGTTFIITLPIGQSQHIGLLFVVNNIQYFFPISHILGITRVDTSVESPKCVYYGQSEYPLFSFAELLKLKRQPCTSSFLPTIIVQIHDKEIALVVDKIVGVREFIIQTTPDILPMSQIFQGLSILFDGEIVYGLDTFSFINSVLPDYSKNPQVIYCHRHAKRDFKILILDDSKAVHHHVQQLLNDDFKNIEIMSSPKEALGYLLEHSVDLILTDIEMPEMDGFSFVRHVKALPNNSSVPIIMMTTRQAVEDIERAQQLGAKSLLYKPLSESLLKSSIKECLYAVH